MDLSLKFFTFVITAVATYAATIALGVSVGRNGNLVVFVVPIITSIVGMGLVRLLWEDNTSLSVGDMYNPSTQSWAFLFGDLLVIPFMLGVSALAWRDMAKSSWFWSPTWFGVAWVAGIVVALVWHFLLDGPGYKAQGYEDMLNSYTKLWHDFVVYGSLSTLIIYLCIPALVSDPIGFGGMALLGLVCWAVLGVLDNTVHSLDPTKLHPSRQSVYDHLT